MNRILRALVLGAALLSGGCAPAAPRARGLVRAGTPDDVNIALARASGHARAFDWAPFAPETFERARREGKPILLDGSAAWCHWCHVMDETTYADPEVGALLRDRFIAVRVDIDERPDIAERYGAWGWPATILFSPSAEELGKHRGYIASADLLAILRDVVATAPSATPPERDDPAKDRAPPLEAMPWIAGRAAVDMDAYYDPKQGGWGMRQKAPLGYNAQVEVIRASHGDEAARARVTFSLAKQRAILDPVWGGIYQYSAGSDWSEPHFEKLMTYQSENLEAYARAFALTRDPRLRADAELIARYMTTFLCNEEGAFLPAQDADVGAHDPSAPFVDGHVYYALGDAGRRTLGFPRVDPAVYPLENGLAITALVAFHEATGDAVVLAKARRAADVVLRAFVADDGSVRRSKAEGGVRFLADAGSFGRALVRLAAVTGDARYREIAFEIAASIQRDFADPSGTALFDHTLDAAAAGVFARRERSFEPNLLVVRFFAQLARTTNDAALLDRARRLLAAISTPRALDARGRMLGEYLLATDETGFYPW